MQRESTNAKTRANDTHTPGARNNPRNTRTRVLMRLETASRATVLLLDACSEVGRSFHRMSWCRSVLVCVRVPITVTHLTGSRNPRAPHPPLAQHRSPEQHLRDRLKEASSHNERASPKSRLGVRAKEGAHRHLPCAHMSASPSSFRELRMARSRRCHAFLYQNSPRYFLRRADCTSPCVFRWC